MSQGTLVKDLGRESQVDFAPPFIHGLSRVQEGSSGGKSTVLGVDLRGMGLPEFHECPGRV